MSGGHFENQQYRMRDIANTIENDIARALKPKPPMVHEDYWSICEHDSSHSYHGYFRYQNRQFQSYEDAETYLNSMENIVKAEHDYDIRHFDEEDAVFESKDFHMRGTADDVRIPVLYSIRHCVYDHYPYDIDVLELENATIETMKIAYRQLRIAEIYAQRVDWMMSGDDGEESLQKRLKEELEEFEKEFANKDWTTPHEGWADED